MHPNAKLFALSAMAIWMAGATAKAQEGQTVNEGYPQSPENSVQSGRPNSDVTGVDDDVVLDDSGDEEEDDVDDSDVVTGDGDGDGGLTDESGDAAIVAQ